MKVLITDKINEKAADIVKAVAEAAREAGLDF